MSKSTRKDKTKRRNLNSEESESMGFTDLQSNADDEGWPYPDDDDGETTEHFQNGSGFRTSGRRFRDSER